MSRAQIEALRAQRATIVAEVDASFEQAKTEERSFDATESAAFEEKMSRVEGLDSQIEHLVGAEEREREANRRLVELGLADSEPASPGDTPRISVGEEPRTYSRDPEGPRFFLDLVRSRIHNDSDAVERLTRNNRETVVDMERRIRDARARRDPAEFEMRDVTRVAGAGGEFVPPLWLIDQYVPFLRASRVTADLCTKMPMPPGTDSINLPVVATGTTTAPQSADAAAISDTSLTTSSISVPVRTIAGQQEIALQLLEQSPISFDEVVFQDLASSYAQQLDLQVLSGTGASGQMLGITATSGINTVTYTDASPTVPEAYGNLADAQQRIASFRFAPMTAWVMHPRRAGWFLSALDSNNRPLVVPVTGGAFNAAAVQDVALGEGGPTFSLMGDPVYLDANVPTNLGAGTNQDIILGARWSDSYLWEGAIRTRVLPEVVSANLEVRLQLYAYTAFSAARRPVSISEITGTGLVAPTF